MKKSIVVMSAEKYNNELENARQSAVVKCGETHSYNLKKSEKKSKATTISLGACLAGSLITNLIQRRKIRDLKTENAVLREVIATWGKKEE